MVCLVYPVEGVRIALDKIRALDNPSQFTDDELVPSVNYQEMADVIWGI